MNDDREALKHLYSATAPGRSHRVNHYLYFPTQKTATAVAKILRDEGFTTEVRLGAEGTDWLVLASHNIAPSEEAIATSRKLMEGLAEKEDGEYDGWEVEVGQ
jgi:hypothetical protein